MPGNIGPMEIILVLVIALLVLGPKKLPEVGRSVGKGLREFKDSVSGITGKDDDDDDAYTLTNTKASSTTPVEATPVEADPVDSTPVGSEPSKAS